MDITVVIPCYNATATIGRALASVAAQTGASEVECIIVDDASTDNTADYVEAFIEKQSKIAFLLIRQSVNAGPSAARNRGIEAAQGEYLFFLDADDELLPHALERLLDAAKKTDADYVQGTYEGRAPAPTKVKSIKRTLLNHLITPFTPHNRLVRRVLITEHNIYFCPGIIHEDNHWMFFLAKHVRRYAAVSVPTYRRHHTRGSLSQQHRPCVEQHSYRVLIADMAANIDPVCRRAQQALLLETLAIALPYYPTPPLDLYDTVAQALPLTLRPLFRHWQRTHNELPLRIMMKWLSPWLICLH